VATGWLGWSPEVAWHTPIPQIVLAMDYRIDWAQKTNPFGSKKKPAKSSPKMTPEQVKQVFGAIGVKKRGD
jgi:hypothetical protein